MPVNLTKMMQKATSYPKVTFNAHYFHKDLTGMGKKVGLINQKTDSIVELTKFQQAVPNFLTTTKTTSTSNALIITTNQAVIILLRSTLT